MEKKYIRLIAVLLAVMLAAVAIVELVKRSSIGDKNIDISENLPQENVIFDLCLDNFRIDSCVIKSGETLSTILSRYGIGASTCDQLGKVSDSVFSLRNIRADCNYMALTNKSDSTNSLAHLIYQQNVTDFVIFSFHGGDSVSVRRDCKDVNIRREKHSGKITSSLWNAMADGGMPASMAMELSEIFAWSVDFFGLQRGDHFTVIYDNLYVDSTSVGVGRIWGAIFDHNGKEYYAIPFMKNGKVMYWDLDGNSLRKNMLKAPLKFSRISSRFSNSRLHPVYKIRRPHHGVDYAAPAGTPVQAVADGVVTQKGYSGGAGHMVKIKHSRNLMSGYLHLSRYGKGVSVGRRVNQGDVIGYVGSTGASTGPHLDFRLWRNGKAIDPLKVPSEPTEPIASDRRADFDLVKERIVAELHGEMHDSTRIIQLEQRPFTQPLASQPTDGQ